MTPVLAIVYHRQNPDPPPAALASGTRASACPTPTQQVLFPDQNKPVPAQYNAAHALSKQDRQPARADATDTADLH